MGAERRLGEDVGGLCSLFIISSTSPRLFQQHTLSSGGGKRLRMMHLDLPFCCLLSIGHRCTAQALGKIWNSITFGDVH